MREDHTHHRGRTEICTTSIGPVITVRRSWRYCLRERQGLGKRSQREIIQQTKPLNQHSTTTRLPCPAVRPQQPGRGNSGQESNSNICPAYSTLLRLTSEHFQYQIGTGKN
ncbi:unnamed protein product [Protopolystoma xenopodis]|uniref:Uncharacterized protein n=1 Tax=Protopolystoma xenopodis TaxID=117903 RepID=A0A3S5A5R9_9PLAT|nr:unnamed protein product [Protopolystoma xenopodis]